MRRARSGHGQTALGRKSSHPIIRASGAQPSKKHPKSVSYFGHVVGMLREELLQVAPLRQEVFPDHTRPAIIGTGGGGIRSPPSSRWRGFIFDEIVA